MSDIFLGPYRLQRVNFEEMIKARRDRAGEGSSGGGRCACQGIGRRERKEGTC